MAWCSDHDCPDSMCAEYDHSAPQPLRRAENMRGGKTEYTWQRAANHAKTSGKPVLIVNRFGSFELTYKDPNAPKPAPPVAVEAGTVPWFHRLSIKFTKQGETGWEADVVWYRFFWWRAYRSSFGCDMKDADTSYQQLITTVLQFIKQIREGTAVPSYAQFKWWRPRTW